ncbi:MAG: hypothetical protein HKN91_05940 [Acidimicrobiia bacterium]|nr:hypothetical protein [Acidimicrobiia bacterium]
MRKLWIPLLGIGGAVGVIQSVFWEFARMRPDYQFIVTPWSIRGTDTVHGSIYVALGVLALAAFFLVMWEGSTKQLNSIAIVGVIIAGGTIIAAVFANDPYVFTPGPPVVGGSAILLGVALFRYLRGAVLPDIVDNSFIARTVVGFVTIGIVGFIVNALIGGDELTIDVWVGVLAILVGLGLLSIATEPRELAANRMLMFSTTIAAFAMALSSGAVRSTLIRLQEEGGFTAGLYKDTQVTSGHLIGVVAMFIVTIAAIMLWARRRDAIQTSARAARQRAAAEESAREIEEAIRRAAELQQQS